MKILGREPAALEAAFISLITFVVAFQLDGLSEMQATNLIALVSAIGGLVTTWMTVNNRLGGVTAVGRALLILAASYGLNLNQEQIGLAGIAITAVAGLWLRGNTSPVETPLTSP